MTTAPSPETTAQLQAAGGAPVRRELDPCCAVRTYLRRDARAAR